MTRLDLVGDVECNGVSSSRAEGTSICVHNVMKNEDTCGKGKMICKKIGMQKDAHKYI